ncbi:MAG: hypothetical protein PHT98_14125 [Kiritimatiellae bacterium]|jgi:hypothetical protein|nr:hypothetical protein [Kiritimatiellia bacterium]
MIPPDACALQSYDDKKTVSHAGVAFCKDFFGYPGNRLAAGMCEDRAFLIEKWADESGGAGTFWSAAACRRFGKREQAPALHKPMTWY